MDSRTKIPKMDPAARDVANRSFQKAKELQSDGLYNHALASYEEAAGALGEIPSESWTRADFLSVMKILGKMLGLIAGNKIVYPSELDEAPEAYDERVWQSTTYRINMITKVMNTLSAANASASLAPTQEVAKPIPHKKIRILFSDSKTSPGVAASANEVNPESPAAYRYSDFERDLFYLNELESDVQQGQPLFTSDGPVFK